MLKSLRALMLLVTLNLALTSCAYALDEAVEIKNCLEKHAYLVKSDSPMFSLSELKALSAEEFNQRLKQYDRYASYLTPQSFASKLKQSAPHSAGVGMELVYDRDTNVRCIPFKDSPADRAGIEYQDILREVNGQQIQGLSLEDLAALIRGKAGSSVKLLVEKYDGWRESYTIKRSNQSYADLIKSGQTPETIKISRFSKGVAQALKAELLKLKTPPHKRIFLDLRGNTGGYLEEGAACAALFLNKGETLYTYQSKTGTTVHKTTEDGPECARKLIILMDELTASSAELLITALKQRQEVGTYGYPTAGKSLIQEVFNLKNGAVLKLSVGELLYAGKPYGWQDEGLKPDVEQH